jgi:hypothetical protein
MDHNDDPDDSDDSRDEPWGTVPEDVHWVDAGDGVFAPSAETQSPRLRCRIAPGAKDRWQHTFRIKVRAEDGSGSPTPQDPEPKSPQGT